MSVRGQSLLVQRPRAGVQLRQSSASYVACVLIVYATVSWRPDSLYSGGADLVVVAKALLTAVALSVAVDARLRRRSPQPIRTLPVWFVGGFLSISTFGAYSTDVVVPSLILGVRVGVLVMIVLVLARTFPAEELLRSWFSAIVTVALLASVTGLPSLRNGRLRGGIPLLHPNEIATLCGIASIGVAWLVFQGRARARHGVLLLLLLVIVYATGSRTSLLAVSVALLVMIPQARRLNRVTTVAIVGAACALIYVTVATDVFGSFFGRGGSENISTLSSRTYAWSAAFHYSDSGWVQAMGSGLGKKEVAVIGQYNATQLLDSSWISALVQAGRVGAVLLIVWAAWALVLSFTGHRDRRMIFVPLMAFLLVRSVLESGLVDSTTTFVTFFLVSVLAGAPPQPLLSRPMVRSVGGAARGGSRPAGRTSAVRAL